LKYQFFVNFFPLVATFPFRKLIFFDTLVVSRSYFSLVLIVRTSTHGIVSFLTIPPASFRLIFPPLPPSFSILVAPPSDVGSFSISQLFFFYLADLVFLGQRGLLAPASH